MTLTTSKIWIRGRSLTIVGFLTIRKFPDKHYNRISSQPEKLEIGAKYAKIGAIVYLSEKQTVTPILRIPPMTLKGRIFHTLRKECLFWVESTAVATRQSVNSHTAEPQKEHETATPTNRKSHSNDSNCSLKRPEFAAFPFRPPHFSTYFVHFQVLNFDTFSWQTLTILTESEQIIS